MFGDLEDQWRRGRWNQLLSYVFRKAT